MRIVLDTNILVRAHARATGPAREVLRLITLGSQHLLVTSQFILDEVERALHYPRLQAQWPLTEAEIQAFVAELETLAEVVDLRQSTPGSPLSADPDDEPIIETAKTGEADVLCTRDRHLRRSRKVREYFARYGIQVMTDEELLSLLRGGHETER